MEKTNAVIETIMSRRSIRKYTDQAVEEEKIQTIIECGINAPTGKYKQSWQVRVVRNPELLAAIDRSFEEQREREGVQSRTKAFYDAPCLIFVAYDKNYDLASIDCGLLGENIMLAAQSLGLGTCCLAQVVRFMNSDDAVDLYKQLNIPDTYQLYFAISVGYPATTPEARPRDITKVQFID